uniref:Aromatic-L-amino-acid decarboxylase n=1 Tax=Megaselia scalaris TaxID=36166 RepID=T1H3V5_MEGSC
MNVEEFRGHAKNIVDFIANYCKHIESKDVLPGVEPGFLPPLLQKECPEKGEPFDKIFKDFEEKVLPGMTPDSHPNYFAYFSCGLSFPGILGEMLAHGFSSRIFTWINSPSGTELENIMMNWYGKAIVFQTRCGVLQSSSSECILTCLLVARSHKVDLLRGNSNIHESEFLPKLVAYSSQDAHYSIEKAAKISFTKINLISCDDKGRMRSDLLEKSIKEDINSGLIPCFVMATLGTTNCAAFDDAEAIGKICREYKIWFHIDGSYGTNAFILPELRHFGKGMEYADSINANAGKMLLINHDSAAMWVKDSFILKKALSASAVYVDNHSNNNCIDYRNYGIALGRRMRAFKFWFVFRSYGLSGLREYVSRMLNMAKLFVKLVKEDDRFEVVNDVNLTLSLKRIAPL